MPRFHRTAHRVSLTAMFAAMSLLFLYLASVLPTLRIAMYFLSSVFVMGLVIEEEIGLAIMMYIGVSLMSMLLMPNPIPRALPYILFFGHYGIGKYFIQSRVKDKIVAYVLKLIYYNVAVALIYVLAKEIILQDVPIAETTFWLFVVLAEVAFVVYDFLYDKVTSFYFNNLRRMLMKN